jgi:hypothetical protein
MVGRGGKIVRALRMLKAAQQKGEDGGGDADA